MITARSLLLGFLDLRSLSPELAEWTEERLADNPPRLYRLRQLTALFRAFDLPWDPQAFTEGKFIEPEHPRYAGLLVQLAEALPEGARRTVRNRQLTAHFEKLFNYRTRVDEVLTFSSGALEASGLYLLAYRKVEKLNRVIRVNVASIDDTLVALISPEGASFSMEQLVRDYGYPDVDLWKIDVDWT